MTHPAYTDLFCDRHENWHQSDICPRCELEDEELTCYEHGEKYTGEMCELCEEQGGKLESCEDHGGYVGRCKQCDIEESADRKHDAMKDERCEAPR